MTKNNLTSKARIFLASVIALTLLISFLVAYAITLRVEFETRRTVDQAVPVQDMGWIRSRYDGAVVTLSGQAPDDAARFRVIEAVSEEINIRRIDDQIVTPEVDITGPELSIEIVQNSHMSSIIGLLPKEPSPVELYYALDSANPNVETLNLVETLETPVDESWAEKMKYVVYLVENVSNAQISATEDEVVLETVVPDGESAEELKKKLASQAPEGYKADLNITSPRPLITPFIFEEVTKGDTVEVLRCSATDEDDLNEIREQLPTVSEDSFAACQLGLGAPTDDWGLLVSQILSDVKPLADHKLSINDTKVKMEYSDSMDAELVEQVSSDIRAALPPGFGFDSQRIVQVKSIEELQEAGDSVVLNVTKDISGTASIGGALGSEAMLSNVQSIAVAKFGSGEIGFDLQLVEGLPSYWEKAVYSIVTAIASLNEGEATMTDEFLSISGTAPDAETKTRIIDSLKNDIGDLTLQDQIIVSENSVLAAQADPLECVERINTVLNESPVQFEPSSSKISESSETVITEIAQILYECRGHEFEIGGHTDSKGSEEVNLRISQSRAQSVLDAVMATSLEFGPLTAKGYGESEPIADNDTEEGRSQNRRIEIRLNAN